MRGRLTSSHLVGRVGELAELELASRDAAAGRPVLVLLGGESGVGKTRLVGEFEQRLVGTVVLRGEGVEQGDAELPYAPLLGALRPLVREHHPALEALSTGSRSALAALLPALGNGEHPAEGDQGEQLRLFEALLELLDLLSDSSPVVLILEDMHWADRSTRTFTAFLARTLRQERVMLLLTYRTDELHRRHALRPLLAELERLGRARPIELAPFDRGELTEALADILGDEPSDKLVQRLYSRSEGNPLYTEELLAAGLDGRGAAPQSLRDAFLLRIERLSDDARLIARAVAAGRGLDDPTIARVTGIEGERLTSALREAVAEQVLVTGKDDLFMFRHALLREALYDDLLPGERAELHHALASALEQLCGDDEDGELELTSAVAGHYASAGDQPAALRATVRAARAAERAYAFGEAANLAERALELWPRVDGAAELLGMDHPALLALAARAHVGGGDMARAESLRHEALRELDPEADLIRYACVLGKLARTQWSLNRGAEGVATAERALAMLPSDSDSERAWLLGWLARVRFLRGRFREATEDGREALALAVQSGDTDSESEVLNTLGMAGVALGDVDEGVACLQRALQLAHEAGDQDGCAYVYANLADMLNIAGRTADALATAQEGLAAIPGRLRDNYDWLTLTVSELGFESGDWELARSHLVSPDAGLVGRQLIYALLREAEQALGEGDDERAAGALEAAQPLVAASSEPQWIGSFGTLLADLLRRRGELEQARAAVSDALDRIELCTDDVMRLARVTAVGMAAEADMAQRARDLRERKLERDALTRARIHIERLRAAAQSGGPVEGAWRAVGEASLTRARGRNDPKLWRKVAAEWEALGRPYQAAIARWREAEAQVESGDRAAAQPVAHAAFEVARRLGAGWLEGELVALAGRARLELASGAVGDTQPRVPDAPEDPFGLTARERQVLALVAQGATNRQIGAALFMAEKTASVHVSRILAKLGVQSRTQAAAVALRQHLA